MVILSYNNTSDVSTETFPYFKNNTLSPKHFLRELLRKWRRLQVFRILRGLISSNKRASSQNYGSIPSVVLPSMSSNPATLEAIATLPEMNATDTAKAVTAAHEAFKSYKKTSARQRARWLRQWYALCMEHLEDLALILTLENGKPLAEAKGEVIYAASFLDWFAAEAERTHGEVVPAANLGQRILTIKEPVGVAACLVPWNFPIAMITRKVGAALAAGCTTVWKPAGETPLSALAQALLAQEAGFPKGTVNVVTTLNNVAEVGEALCKSKLIRKLSFTGSTRVGKILVEQSSANLTKLSLELGGNSPFIVFDNAKVETAVDACMLAKFRGSGQTCVTANRIFVQEGVYDRFTSALVKRIEKLKVGNGTDSDVAIGPLAHERAVEKALVHIKGMHTVPFNPCYYLLTSSKLRRHESGCLRSSRRSVSEAQ